MPAFAGMTVGGVRGVSYVASFPRPFQNVIPAKAGIQRLQSHAAMKPWMPAFAGMTTGGARGVSPRRNLCASSRPLLPHLYPEPHPAFPPERHPREGGDPETSESCRDEALDARLRGHDDRWGSRRFSAT